tara:strand:+ start:911 stop:1114 length:204 start_codon:yes stop_codon:yes gene_type:complete
VKKRLKKEISIVKDKIISLNFVLMINSKLLTGKKPPEEIKVNDRLNELKALKSEKYKIKNIIDVSNK